MVISTFFALVLFSTFFLNCYLVSDAAELKVTFLQLLTCIYVEVGVRMGEMVSGVLLAEKPQSIKFLFTPYYFLDCNHNFSFQRWLFSVLNVKIAHFGLQAMEINLLFMSYV